MKNFFVCSSVLALLVLAGRGNADEHFPFLAKVSRGPVNVRAGANTNFEVVDKLAQGAQVVVVGRNYEWYKVQLPDTAAAYVRADYVKVHRGNIGEITGSRVNVRAKASSESSALGSLDKGDLVKLGEKTQEWWKIDPPAGSTAWINNGFLKLESPEVPAKLLRRPLELRIDQEAPPVKPSISPSDVLPVSVQGLVQALPKAASTHVHYEVLVGGKPAYYLHDVPHLDRFSGAMVRLEGKAAPEDGSALPVLQVRKISLVL